jgi:protein ImuA
MTAQFHKTLLLNALRRKVARLEGVRRPCAEMEAQDAYSSSGCPALDRLLPQGGFPRGALIVWLGPQGGGAGTLALLAAREATRPAGALVVLDRAKQFYPPAAAAWGLDLHRLMVVRPRTTRDAIWALDQVLRCRGVGAVWAPLERLDARSFRRLQLAAEASQCLAFLLRPPRLRGQPSWAEMQLLVAPSSQGSRGGRRWRIELTRCRGAPGGGAIELEMDEQNGEMHEVSSHETHALPMAPTLAHSAPARREARA